MPTVQLTVPGTCRVEHGGTCCASALRVDTIDQHPMSMLHRVPNERHTFVQASQDILRGKVKDGYLQVDQLVVTTRVVYFSFCRFVDIPVKRRCPHTHNPGDSVTIQEISMLSGLLRAEKESCRGAVASFFQNNRV